MVTRTSPPTSGWNRCAPSTCRCGTAALESSGDGEDVGFAVRVVVDGTWGFAAGVDLTPEAVVTITEQAVEVARVAAALSTERVELAPEPSPRRRHLDLRVRDRPLHHLRRRQDRPAGGLDRRVLDDDRVSHVDAHLEAVRENKFFADLAGTFTTQQRVRVHPVLTAVRVNSESGDFETMRTLPSAGRPWLGVPARSAAGIANSPSCQSYWPKRWLRPASRPARTTS